MQTAKYRVHANVPYFYNFLINFPRFIIHAVLYNYIMYSIRGENASIELKFVLFRPKDRSKAIIVSNRNGKVDERLLSWRSIVMAPVLLLQPCSNWH